MKGLHQVPCIYNCIILLSKLANGKTAVKKVRIHSETINYYTLLFLLNS